MHGVEVVTVPDPDTIAAALEAPGSTCFVLTNSRSLPESEAIGRARELAVVASRARAALRRPDRGRQPERLDASRSCAGGDHGAGGRRVASRAAGDTTACCSCRAISRLVASPPRTSTGPRIGDGVVAVGQTEFARDTTFGYSNSDLRLFLEEKSGGAIAAERRPQHFLARHPPRAVPNGSRRSCLASTTAHSWS